MARCATRNGPKAILSQKWSASFPGNVNESLRMHEINYIFIFHEFSISKIAGDATSFSDF